MATQSTSGSKAPDRGGRRRRPHPLHARRRPVPHGPRHVGDERLHRHRRQGRRHHGHRHPDGDHPLHAGHGQPHGAGRQDRQHHRLQARLHDRLHHLRLRLGDHGARAQPHGADHRLVVPRGHRRRAHHAGHRRPRGQQLPARGAAQGLRARLRRGGDRRRRRAGDRRLHDHLLLLALRLRRRGRHRHRHPPAGAARRRLTGRASPAPRPHRRRGLVGRARALRDRRAQVVDLGLDHAQGRRTLALRPFADHLVHARRPLHPLAVLPLPAAARAHRQGAAHRAIAAEEPPADRRTHQLPVHVPDPVRHLLHRAAVPLGGRRPLADRDRRAPAAALALAAARRRRHPAPAPSRQSAPRRAHRPAGARSAASSC